MDSTTTELRNACTPQVRERWQLLEECKRWLPFVFDGGSPGWQEAGGQPTVETEILVSRDGASNIDVVDNGSPR